MRTVQTVQDECLCSMPQISGMAIAEPGWKWEPLCMPSKDAIRWAQATFHVGKVEWRLLRRLEQQEQRKLQLEVAKVVERVERNLMRKRNMRKRQRTIKVAVAAGTAAGGSVG